jgi:hypothetical protein
MWCSYPEWTKLTRFLLIQKKIKKIPRNPKAIFNPEAIPMFWPNPDPDPEPKLECQSRWALVRDQEPL